MRDAMSRDGNEIHALYAGASSQSINIASSLETFRCHGAASGRTHCQARLALVFDYNLCAA